ncbi:MAG: NAD-dependent epimerase/dehydratase family protein [Leptolyngbyaceae cyanobacterium]
MLSWESSIFPYIVVSDPFSISANPRVKRIFITGASGCVGHYLVETLLNNTPHQLFLLVRNPAKLLFNWQDQPRITVIQDDIRNVEAHADLLKTIDTAVLTATSWGGAQEIYDINVTGNHRLMALLDVNRCEQVLYFSTASILDSHNRPLPEAGQIGTDYIRSKYQCYLKLPELAICPKITTVFPTLVFGGDKDKPYSHISAGLQEVANWMWLIRFLKADGSFHFAHGKDIALVVSHLIDHPPVAGEPRQVIIGNPALTVNQAIEEISEYLGLRIFFRMPLSLWLADRIIDGFNIRMAEWDRFCLKYRHQIYQNPQYPERLGLKPACPTIADLMRLSHVMPG